MWLAQSMKQAVPTADADQGISTIVGDQMGVVTRGEVRQLPIYGPGGYVWLPESGASVLVIKGGTLGEERYVAGSLDAAREQDDLDDGEVRIYAESGGASITLRRNGHVEIEGDLFINGAMYVPPVS